MTIYINTYTSILKNSHDCRLDDCHCFACLLWLFCFLSAFFCFFSVCFCFFSAHFCLLLLFSTFSCSLSASVCSQSALDLASLPSPVVNFRQEYLKPPTCRKWLWVSQSEWFDRMIHSFYDSEDVAFSTSCRYRAWRVYE